eukprot:1398283-Pleurochrysis_carterae.AAC.3
MQRTEVLGALKEHGIPRTHTARTVCMQTTGVVDLMHSSCVQNVVWSRRRNAEDEIQQKRG